jgi:hypothetical protein
MLSCCQLRKFQAIFLIKMDEEIKTFLQIIALTQNSDTNQMQSELLKPTDSTEKENTYLLDDSNDSDGFLHITVDNCSD